MPEQLFVMGIFLLYFRNRMKRRATDFLKALDEGKLTESQETHRFAMLYNTLSREEKVIDTVKASQ